jgi:hypothetical protein
MVIEPRKLNQPAKPLVKISTIFRMFSRQAQPQCPESNLVVGVICQAIYDCLHGTHVEKCRAWNFMHDERLDIWAGTVSLDANFIREVALKTHYMSPAAPAQANKNYKKGGKFA